MTQKIETISELKAALQLAWQKQQTVGLVPTMGNLHKGHASLLDRAKRENDLCVLSVFVNPTQFNEAKDYAQYPKTWQEDYNLAEKNGVDIIFTPSEKSLYPDQYNYRVSETSFSKQLEGKHRPGHFDGMLTIVLKLLQLVKPQRAYFGEKDYQQYLLVRGMTEALFVDTEIVLCPTIREASGLAYSSRNNLLSVDAREKAAQLYQELINGTDCAAIQNRLEQLDFKVDYVEDSANRRLVAAHFTGVRLIDNIPLKTK